MGIHDGPGGVVVRNPGKEAKGCFTCLQKRAFMKKTYCIFETQEDIGHNHQAR